MTDLFIQYMLSNFPYYRKMCVLEYMHLVCDLMVIIKFFCVQIKIIIIAITEISKGYKQCFSVPLMQILSNFLQCNIVALILMGHCLLKAIKLCIRLAFKSYKTCLFPGTWFPNKQTDQQLAQQTEEHGNFSGCHVSLKPLTLI